MSAQLSDQAARLLQAGQWDQAGRLFEQVLQATPDDFAANQGLGIIRFQEGRMEEALALFDNAAGGDGNFGLLSNRGAALQALGRYDEALASYDAAAALAPASAAVHYNRGRLLQDMGSLDHALASYEQAVALEPGHVAALTNRGNALRSMNRNAEALESYDRALALKPDFVEALYNRGNLYWAVNGDYPAAMRDLEKAAALNPAYDYVLGELLYLRLHGGDWRDFDGLSAFINDGVRAGRRVIQPFHYQAIAPAPAAVRACAEIFTRHHFPPMPPLAPARAARRDRIRLGYVAGEFREHATAHLMAGLFESHDRKKFELVAFDNGWDDGSPMRARLARAFGETVDISGLSNRAAAEEIRRREIDVLVNLNGYVGLHRMGVFAHRPAPVQVNYLGSPATSGTPYLDYILADQVLIPDGEERFYSEKVVRLPQSYQVNDARRAIGDAPGRAELGLPDGAFVFCSFNSSYKLTPGIFRLWMAILREVPGSVLWLLESNPDFAANLRRAAAASGIAPERLVFAPMIAQDRHLARMARADLFLDLLPCGAHTTASDALWAGLPLVTCRGPTFAGRVAASLLGAVGLPQLVTENLDDYKSLVLRLAGNPDELAALRRTLAEARVTAPLFDTVRTTRALEAAFATMVDIAARGEAPRGFCVPD